MAMSDKVFLEEYWHFWNLGYTLRDIAKIFEVNQNAVERRVEKLGLPRYRGQERYTADLIDEAVEQGGLVVVELLPEGIDLHAARGRILHHVRKGNIHPEPIAQKSYKRRKPPKAWVVVQ